MIGLLVLGLGLLVFCIGGVSMLATMFNRLIFMPRWFAVVGLCLVGGMTLLPAAQAQTIQREGDGYVARIEAAFNVAPGGALDMRNVVGSVSVRAGSGRNVQVVEEVHMKVRSRDAAAELLPSVKATYRHAGNRVTVDGRADARRRNSPEVNHHYRVVVPQRFEVTVNTTGGAIRVEGTHGEIDVNTAGGPIHVAHVVGDVQANSAGGALDFQDLDGDLFANTAGGSIHVRGITGTVNAATAGGAIHIEEVRSDVTARTAGGTIFAAAVQGRLDAQTAGGNLTLRNIRGPADANTSGGSINLRDMTARVRVQTAGGDIRGSGFQGPVEAETAAGDIDLRDVRNDVEAQTSVGRIDIDMSLEDFSRPHSLRLRTTFGDIRVRLPARLPATVIARVYSNTPGARHEIQSDFPLARNRTDGTLYSEGDLNSGGDRIDLRAHGGNIYIEKK